MLLELVEKRKLLINDISLAAVTDEYMAHVARMQESSLQDTANFVALAATLLLIKSKSLLPVLELTDEEEGSIEELEERLRLYQIYRNVSLSIMDIFGVRVMHERGYSPLEKPVFKPDEFCTAPSLLAAMRSVLSELPVKIEKPRVQVKKVISLEEMIDNLHRRIEKQLKLKFSELVSGSVEKHTYIVGFLAVLESVKQGSILVTQLGRFDDIEIERAAAGVPKYF